MGRVNTVLAAVCGAAGWASCGVMAEPPSVNPPDPTAETREATCAAMTYGTAVCSDETEAECPNAFVPNYSGITCGFKQFTGSWSPCEWNGTACVTTSLCGDTMPACLGTVVENINIGGSCGTLFADDNGYCDGWAVCLTGTMGSECDVCALIETGTTCGTACVVMGNCSEN